MTPAEMRHQANQLRAQAGRLDADAKLLAEQSGSIRGLLDPLVGMSQRAWIGPAADDFERQVRNQGFLIDEQAARLERIAGQLARRAVDARGKARNLDAQAARDELTAVVGGSDTPVVTDLS